MSLLISWTYQYILYFNFYHVIFQLSNAVYGETSEPLFSIKASMEVLNAVKIMTKPGLVLQRDFIVKFHMILSMFIYVDA